MKKYFFIFMFLTAVLFFAQTNVIDLNKKYAGELAPGKIYFIFESKVKIRDNSGLESNVLGMGSIGEQVEVIQKIEKEEEIYGFTANWYKIKWKNVTGFIWGGLLADNGFSEDFNNDGIKEILIYRAVGSFDFMGKKEVKFKLCLEGIIINENLSYEITPIFGIGFGEVKIHKNSGKFKPDVILIEIACGFGDGPGGSATRDFYFIKNNNMVQAFKFRNDYYLDDSTETEVVFSENNMVLLKTTEIKYDYKDDMVRSQLKSKIVTEKKFQWNGSAFTVKN